MLKRLGGGRFLAVVLGAYAVLGVIGGLLWRLWWTAPSGMVFSHQWIPGVKAMPDGSLYPLADPPQAIPATTAHWAIIAIAVGLVGGMAVVLAAKGREYGALAATVVGSLCAGLLMWGVGYLDRGADPRAAARSLPDGKILTDHLQLGSPWLLIIPLAVSGAVLAVAFLGWGAYQPLESTENVDEGL